MFGCVVRVVCVQIVSQATVTEFGLDSSAREAFEPGEPYDQVYAGVGGAYLHI